jgi:ssDNA-binding Zn-finger/Zn-ribbon topoisomerase 1
MLVTTCPNCTVELDLEPNDAGHLVECPACLTKFHAPKPTLPAPAMVAVPPLPPPPSKNQNTLVVQCPRCDGTVSILTEDIGHRVICPRCDKTFTAQDPTTTKLSTLPKLEIDPTSKPSRRKIRRDWDDDDDSPESLVEQAEYRLRTPGGGLEVLGWIDIVAGVISLIIGGVALAGAIGSKSSDFTLAACCLGLGLSGMILGAIKVYGGKAMKRANNRTLAILAAVVGCIPLNINPCLAWLLFPTYILSLIFGIIAMANLFRADVKKAFELNHTGGDPDAVI